MIRIPITRGNAHKIPHRHDFSCRNLDHRRRRSANRNRLLQGYAKTEVNWLSWIVHYSYWWNEERKITRMSLQYAD